MQLVLLKRHSDGRNVVRGAMVCDAPILERDPDLYSSVKPQKIVDSERNRHVSV